MNSIIQSDFSETILNKDFQKIENLTFVKWAGGKTQLISQISDFLPKKIENYYEPFVGGGAIFFYIMQKFKPKSAYISDLNKELIISYIKIRDNLLELIKLLKKHRKNHNKEYYYKIRKLEIDKLADIEIAARFIYLNKTCFNGLYRVNLKGGFNVPIGSSLNPSIFDEEKLEKISFILNQNVTIKHVDFLEVEKYIKPNSFVYFDPPYYPLEGKKSFISYTKNSFLDKEQEDLSKLYVKLNKLKIKLILSNSDTKFIKNLYLKFKINFVSARRMINCDGKNRGKINEVLILNY